MAYAKSIMGLITYLQGPSGLKKAGTVGTAGCIGCYMGGDQLALLDKCR